MCKIGIVAQNGYGGDEDLGIRFKIARQRAGDKLQRGAAQTGKHRRAGVCAAGVGKIGEVNPELRAQPPEGLIFREERDAALLKKCGTGRQEPDNCSM